MSSAFEKVLEIMKPKQIGELFDPPITAMAVGKWKHSRIPADRVLIIESAVGGKVSRYEMRPDVFGDNPGHTEAA